MNDPPPGTDEIVAMTKIVTYLEEGYELPNGERMVRMSSICYGRIHFFSLSELDNDNYIIIILFQHENARRCHSYVLVYLSELIVQ